MSVKPVQTEVVVPEQTASLELPANATLPDMVRYQVAAGGVDAPTLQKLLELQTAWEKREAEKEFVAGRARLKFPAIPKTKKSLNSYYATMDSIQEIIDPILASEGFTLSFTSGEPNEKDLIPITGKLSHRLGHSETCIIYQPIGAVSKGMNANQAMGSAISYGQRYCAAMMLNLRFVGMDDDAQSLSYLTESEQMAVEDLIAECGLSPEGRSKFLEFVGAKAVSEISRGAFTAAINFLQAKRRKLGEKK
jgi:hypothetical protein